MICLALVSGVQAAGVLVLRGEKGFQFADAMSISVNGKDKVLNLGAAPRLAGPANKLPSVRLGDAMLMDADSGVIAIYERTDLHYALPEGAPKDAPSDPAGLWKIAKLSYKKSQADKTPVEIGAAAFIAFLPDGLGGLARLCTDERAAGLIGGKTKAFDTQMELLAAAVKAHASNPALAPLEQYVAQSMRERYERFENGLGGLPTLEQGLRFAELSKEIYPTASGQEALRKALTDRKKWLDRKVAILRAFNAGREWDAYILGARDFDGYLHAYPEMTALQAAALKQSLEMHRQAGEERQKAGEQSTAYREFQLASRRQPSDASLQQKILIAWTDYSEQAAIENQKRRKQLTAGQRDAIERSLAVATSLKDRPERALEELRQAESVDPDSLPMLLKKSEIFVAQGAYTKALNTLDQYDRHAVGEERAKSRQLRNTFWIERNSMVEKLNGEFQKAWTASNFHKARDTARQALLVKEDDPEILYQAAAASLAVRDAKSGQEFLKRYLEISNTLDVNPEQRARVRRLSVSASAAAVEQGDANWLSGRKLPKGVFYDPSSMAFQPRVERIEASNKLRITYEWEGERLKAVSPVFEKAEHATGEKKIWFTYDSRMPVVLAAAHDESGRGLAAADPDERFRNSSQVLLNHPDVDPKAIQALTGKNLTLGISGNRFFHPFVWDKIHYFRLSYDGQGRLAQARELAGPGGSPGNQWIEFEWNGPQLAAVRGYQGADEKQRVKNYERILQYQNGRLMSEEIRGNGKTSDIKYKYNANRLVSAECDRDASLDDRSRQVFFLANSPTVQVQ